MSHLVSLCVIKIEIDNLIMNTDENSEAGAVSAEHPTNPRVVREHRGQRKPNKIIIENYTNQYGGSDPKESKGILPKGSREATPLEDESTGTCGATVQSELTEDVCFFSGNPFVEVTKGIIHLYKKDDRIETHGGLSRTLCLLAVPATLSCHDLINFVAPCSAVIQHIRIIRDSSPNQFMVLLEFRSSDSAMEFYKTFNGAPYNSLETDSICHAVWVSSIEWGNDGLPPLGHTELPTCPVCLERMDESIDGVLTILCNHAFHAGCLVKWCDLTCPVCRCVQTPELQENSICMECDGTEQLWICLICGHVGCGRYQGGHAALHYRTTNHTYALQLGTNRVWDYAGDNFVHRLLQCKTDGKLVATQLPNNRSDGDEKMDSMQLEFTYLLTSQLDAQRIYFEEKMVRLEQTVMNEQQELRQRTDKLFNNNTALEVKLNNVTKEKNSLEKKLTQLTGKLNVLTKELQEERQVGKALQLNQTEWQLKYKNLEIKKNDVISKKELEIKDLKEQIRDLMFYMEAQNVIANSELKDEIATTSVTINQAEGTTDGNTNEKTKQRRKKK